MDRGFAAQKMAAGPDIGGFAAGFKILRAKGMVGNLR
jgi:hypothetical protein